MRRYTYIYFDGHVDVLIVDVEGERAGIDVRLDALEPRADGVAVLLADDALRREHGRVRAGAGNVLPVQVPVHGKRRTELLRHLGYRLLKAAAPQRHV